MILPIAIANETLSTVITNATETTDINRLLGKWYTRMVLENPTANIVYVDIGVVATAATSFSLAQNEKIELDIVNTSEINLIASVATNAIAYFTKGL